MMQLSNKTFFLSCNVSISIATSDHSIASSQTATESPHVRLQTSFDKLKSDKEKAFELLRVEIEKWEKNEKQFKQMLSDPDTFSSNGPDMTTLTRHTTVEEAYIAHTRTSMTSDRTHSFTSSINGSDIFYDADDAILTADLSSADLSDLEGAGFDNHADDQDDNSSDEDESSEDTVKETQVAEAPPQQNSNSKKQVDQAPIVRRSVLPAPVSGEDISLLSILRKNVGKDLSTVAMPVSLNEPINVLQRLCEELEYSELLDKAVGLSDSLDRLVYVAAFAVSGYSTSQWRAARKPFNPLHGETFEYDSPEKGITLGCRCCFLLCYCGFLLEKNIHLSILSMS
jgi:hypothetical protein